ncbi:hypothetical protein RND81_02G229700 [Saponaria officinalis]|uniref:GRF-type domain-containing protein n=1 Tax=Saponaria officinalis TaxID=3572 RepID=A0AAW1MYZ8_SAPOF
MSSASSSKTSIELVRCYCTVPAALQTSWTLQNPGRRFFTCKFYNPEMQFRGCNFFKWVDESSTNWQRKVINSLVMEKMSLKQEISEIKMKVGQYEESKYNRDREMAKLKTKCEDLSLEAMKLRKKVKIMTKIIKTLTVLVVFLLY